MRACSLPVQTDVAGRAVVFCYGSAFDLLGGELRRGTVGRVRARFYTDAPVAKIRGSFQGPLGILTLAALTAYSIGEARAGLEPDIYLDDSDIGYKDLAHGTYELTTKEPVPRTIIVDDPGETVIISPTGSGGVGVNRAPNSPTQMEDLHAQSERTAELLRGQDGPLGSGTPDNRPTTPSGPDTHPFSPQPINFIQPESPPAVITTTVLLDVPSPQSPPPPAPQQPIATPTITLAQDTGISATDGITSDGTVRIAGVLPGAPAEFYSDGGQTWSSTPPTFAPDGSQDGAHTIEIRQVDAAHQVSSVGSFTFILDTTAPTETATIGGLFGAGGSPSTQFRVNVSTPLITNHTTVG